MEGAFFIGILWDLVKEGYKLITIRSTDKKKDVIEAHRALNSAFIQTYDYLRNNHGRYIPKPELAEFWNLSSAAMMKIDSGLGEMLYNKSRFWLDPELYINLNRAGEIIELNQIVDEMEHLRMKIK
jgi:hypothetical protein